MSGIVSDPTAMKDLASGWDLIDFESIKNQSALVSNCSHELLGECFESAYSSPAMKQIGKS